jgi:hypothetical protein
VSESVEVEDRQVGLVVTPLRLHVDPGALWYSAKADVRVTPAPEAELGSAVQGAR